LNVQFKKAERKKAKLRLALAGPAGSGKTYGALLVAFGLGGRVAMIDTENHSGELYSHLGDYDVAVIDPPFVPEKYTEAIREAESLGYDTIIIDSLSHAWAGQGGLLDIHGRIADKGGNSWTAWRQVTPRHFELVEAMLQSKCHIIATMRSKMDYMQTEENGKKVIKKVGMNPVQRDGMEYEFTIFMDVDINHLAQATKDRTSLLDGQVLKITQEVGKKLLLWLESGAQPVITPAAEQAGKHSQTANSQTASNKRKTKEERAEADAAAQEALKQSEEEFEKDFDHEESNIDQDLKFAWDVLGTPLAKRSAVLAKPNLNKPELLRRLQAEIDARAATEATAANSNGNKSTQPSFF